MFSLVVRRAPSFVSFFGGPYQGQPIQLGRQFFLIVDSADMGLAQFEKPKLSVACFDVGMNLLQQAGSKTEAVVLQIGAESILNMVSQLYALASFFHQRAMDEAIG